MRYNLAKHYSESKQHFAYMLAHIDFMFNSTRKGLNQVLAENIATAMRDAGIKSQSELARLSGVAQRTISNYLNPSNRVRGKSDKTPSAKLTEIEQIALALNVEPWKLLRPMSKREHDFYERIESAYRAMLESNNSTGN